MMRQIVAIVLFAMTTGINAETLSFPAFRLEVEDGWVHNIETGPQAQALQDRGDLISIYHPTGIGRLKIGAYSAPAFVSKERLRLLTNVDISKPLTWQNWGEYSGYQYDYVERRSFYRQWWLVNDRTILFITYDCDPESKSIETEKIDKIVNSLTVNKS